MNPTSYTNEDRAYALLCHGRSVLNYSNIEYLEDDIGWFKSNNYLIIEINEHATIKTEEDLLKTLQAIPDIGMHSLNFDSFNDGLRDLPVNGLGVIFVFRHIETLLGTHRFLDILDILDGYSRCELLDGKRIITLVQADDPHTNIGRIGENHASWNPREWDYVSRKVDPAKIKNYDQIQKS